MPAAAAAASGSQGSATRQHCHESQWLLLLLLLPLLVAGTGGGTTVFSTNGKLSNPPMPVSAPVTLAGSPNRSPAPLPALALPEAGLPTAPTIGTDATDAAGCTDSTRAIGTVGTDPRLTTRGPAKASSPLLGPPTRSVATACGDGLTVSANGCVSCGPSIPCTIVAFNGGASGAAPGSTPLAGPPPSPSDSTVVQPTDRGSTGTLSARAGSAGPATSPAPSISAAS